MAFGVRIPILGAKIVLQQKLVKGGQTLRIL